MAHIPVLLAESLEFLAVKPGGTYVDATAGLGGHSGEIAARLSGGGTLVMCDRDADSLEMAKANTAAHAERIRPAHGAFSELRRTLDGLGIARVDGLLADLGVSRMQLTEPER